MAWLLADVRAHADTAWRQYVRRVVRMWWSDGDQFAADVRRADDARLLAMFRWAVEHEEGADERGMGRNPRARRLFGGMRRTAATELERRGLEF